MKIPARKRFGFIMSSLVAFACFGTLSCEDAKNRDIADAVDYVLSLNAATVLIPFPYNFTEREIESLESGEIGEGHARDLYDLCRALESKGLITFGEPDSLNRVWIKLTAAGKRHAADMNDPGIGLKYADAKLLKILAIKDHPTATDTSVVSFTYRLSNIARWAAEMNAANCGFEFCDIIKGNGTLAQNIEVTFEQGKYAADPKFRLKSK